jgi:hypothetical protein
MFSFMVVISCEVLLFHFSIAKGVHINVINYI